jgi:hypothetical protein
MKVQLTKPIDLASGSMDDITYKVIQGDATKKMQIISPKTIPFNPNTPAQQEIRNIFGYFQRLLYHGTGKTLGTENVNMTTIKERVKSLAVSADFVGISKTGNNAGFQLISAIAIKNKDNTELQDLITLNELPQDMTEGNNLALLNTVMDNIIDVWSVSYIEAGQKDRLGLE